MDSVLSWGGWRHIPSSSCRAMSYMTLLATSVCPHRGGPTPTHLCRHTHTHTPPASASAPLGSHVSSPSHPCFPQDLGLALNRSLQHQASRISSPSEF